MYNVLIVEDELLVRTGITASVNWGAYDMTVCASVVDGQSAYNAYLEHNADVIITDIKMPNIDGVELAKIVKNIYPKTKIFFCTAYSEYSLAAWNMKVKGYILKPISAQKIEEVLQEMIGDWKTSVDDNKLVTVKTFGDFEVFVNDCPIEFQRSKAKELLAYLVDRKGSSVTTERIAAILFEEKNYDRNVKNMTTTIISSLRKTLKKYGIEDILIKSWNQIAINVDKIKCDAYDFEKFDLIAINSYEGDYMYGYSWAEFSTPKYDKILKEFKKTNK